MEMALLYSGKRFGVCSFVGDSEAKLSWIYDLLKMATHIKVVEVRPDWNHVKFVNMKSRLYQINVVL